MTALRALARLAGVSSLTRRVAGSPRDRRLERRGYNHRAATRPSARKELGVMISFRLRHLIVRFTAGCRQNVLDIKGDGAHQHRSGAKIHGPELRTECHRPFSRWIVN